MALLSLWATDWARSQDGRILRGGWYHWYPYQYLESHHDHETLTGLDILLLRQIMRNAGFRVMYDEVNWKRLLLDIKNGKRDFAAGALITPERQTFAYFTDEVRNITNVLFVRRGESSRFDVTAVEELIQLVDNGEFRLGVVAGYEYGDPKIGELLKAPANSSGIVPVDDEIGNFENLFENSIDGFLVDRLTGYALAWRHGWQSRIEEHPLPEISQPLHVMFSKKTTSPAVVEAFNRSLRQLTDRGELEHITQRYMFPILLSITVERNWFFVIDILGTIAFAISGLILARQGAYDLVGAFVLAALPAMGGGIMRDLLVGRSPIFILRTPAYILAVVITVLAGYIAIRLASRWSSRGTEFRPTKGPNGRRTFAQNGLQVFDAIGLSAFTVIGVVVAVEARAEPLLVWGPLLAMVTGAGGGILRDVVRADANNPFLKGTFYPEVAFIWGLGLSGFLLWQTYRLNPNEIFFAVIVTIGGAFLTRLLAYIFRLRSPLF